MCLFGALLYFFTRFASPEFREPWNWIVTFVFLFLLFAPGLVTVIFLFHQDRQEQWKWQRKLLVLILAALGGMAVSSLPQAILFAHDAPNEYPVLLYYGKLLTEPRQFLFWICAGLVVLFLERTVFRRRASTAVTGDDGQKKVSLLGSTKRRCENLTVLADGTVYACRRFKSPIGKVPEQNFDDLFFSQTMQQYRNPSNYEKCGQCQLFTYCRGCSAVSHCVTGSWQSVDPQCWK